MITMAETRLYVLNNIRAYYPDEDIKIKKKGEVILVVWTLGPTEEEIERVINPSCYDIPIRLERYNAYKIK